MNSIELVPHSILSAAHVIYELNGLDYHNWLHVLNLSLELDTWSDASRMPIDLPTALAVVGHDLVPYNEKQSAALAGRIFIEHGIDEAVIARSRKLIEFTDRRQNPPPDDMLALALGDADRAILGKDPGTYHWYTQAIRREKCQFHDAQFIAGRSRFIGITLQNAPLYRLAYFADRYDAPAKSNLRQELAKLQQGRTA